MSLNTTAARSTGTKKKQRQPKRFVVALTRKISSKDSTTQTIIWNPDRPLALGYPVLWFLERTTDAGIRIRWVGSPVNERVEDAFLEMTEKDLRNASDQTLPGPKDFCRDYSIRVTTAQTIEAPFLQESSESDPLRIYQCIGNWVHDVTRIQKKYVGTASGKTLFEITVQGSQYRIHPLSDGLTLGNKDSEGAAMGSNESTLGKSEILESTLQWNAHSWHFGTANAKKIPSIDVRVSRESSEDLSNLKRSVQIAGALLTLFLAISYFMPKPQEDPNELIPEQYAKIVMTPQEAPKSDGIKEGGGTPAPTKAAQTEVVQAFRAQAVQNAVQGLLKGGLTTLLAQSDLVGGDRSASKKVFNSSATVGNVSDKHLTSSRQIKVSSLGGDAKGKQVGYGKGSVAAVAGQGSSFVSLDSGGSQVEEGLTKDEVGKVIHAHLNEVRYCYESAMIHTPDIEGKLIVDFAIGPAGLVRTAAVKSSTVPDPRLDDCLIRRLKRWQFPHPKGGVTVGVTYPFIFKSLGR